MEASPTPPSESDNAGVPFLPPHVFLGAVVLSLIFQLLLPFFIGGGIGGFLFGFVLGAAGVALIVRCFKIFNAHGTHIRPDQPTNRLIEEGPYRYSRNPIYIGLLLVYIGMALLFGIGWFFLFLPALLMYLRFVVIAREEAYLLRRFESDYIAYCHRVGRWI